MINHFLSQYKLLNNIPIPPPPPLPTTVPVRPYKPTTRAILHIGATTTSNSTVSTSPEPMQHSFSGVYPGRSSFHEDSVRKNSYLPLPRSSGPSVAHMVARPLDVNRPHKKGYATYNVNEPDSNAPDTKKADANNPYIGKKKKEHPEVHRVRCDQPGCTGKTCVGLCGNFKGRTAIGHASHGKTPANEPDKQTVNVSTGIDFSGKSLDQKIVFYGGSHEVNPTPVLPIGTSMINNDPKIQQVIHTFEDKK